MKPTFHLTEDEMRFIVRLYYMKYKPEKIAFCLNRTPVTIEYFLKRKGLEY